MRAIKAVPAGRDATSICVLINCPAAVTCASRSVAQMSHSSACVIFTPLHFACASSRRDVLASLCSRTPHSHTSKFENCNAPMAFHSDREQRPLTDVNSCLVQLVRYIYPKTTHREVFMKMIICSMPVVDETTLTYVAGLEELSWQDLQG